MTVAEVLRSLLAIHRAIEQAIPFVGENQRFLLGQQLLALSAITDAILANHGTDDDSPI